MITMIERNSYTGREIGVGEDQVVASMPIPPGGVFMGFRAEVHGIASAPIDMDSAMLSHIRGVIVPMGGSRMDTAISIQTLWDQLVPKDVDLSVVAGADEIDWDDGAIASPFQEPGQVNFSDLVALGDRPIDIARRNSGLVTLANAGRDPHLDTTRKFQPAFTVRMGSNHKVRVRQASYFLLAVSSPSWDETTNSAVNTIVDANWSALTYPDVMFDMMLPDILGLSETGAESPYSDMAAFAVDLVEPLIREQTAGDFVGGTWNTFTDWSVRVLTPGRPQMRTLASKGV